MSQVLPPMRNILIDFLISAATCFCSFLTTLLVVGIFKPESEYLVDLRLSWLSWSFLIHAAMFMLVLPIFHTLYTLPSYMVSERFGRILRWSMKFILITFPLGLVDDKIAYYVPDPKGVYVVSYFGETLTLDGMGYGVEGEAMKSFTFRCEDEWRTSLGFIESELPEIKRD